MALGCTQGRHRVEAGPVHRPTSGREVGYLHAGPEPSRGSHEASGRPSVKSQRVVHEDRRLDQRSIVHLSRRRARRFRGFSRTQVRGLALQPTERLVGDLLQGSTQPRRRGGGDRTLDERCLGQEYVVAYVRLQHLDGQLRAHDRAAEVHQHENAVIRVTLVDRLEHAEGIRAERIGLVGPRPRQHDDVVSTHLARQFDHSGSDAAAM